jgi:fucose permease
VYYIEERLDFKDSDIANLFLVLGCLGIFIQGFVLKFMNDWLGERRLLIVAFTIGTIHNALYGMATIKAAILIAAAIGSFASMAFPTISAIKSNNVVRNVECPRTISLKVIAQLVGR